MVQRICERRDGQPKRAYAILAIIDSPKGDAASKIAIIRRITDARGAYFDEPTAIGKYASWPKTAVADEFERAELQG